MCSYLVKKKKLCQKTNYFKMILCDLSEIIMGRNEPKAQNYILAAIV